MVPEMPIIEVRNKLTTFPKHFERHPEKAAVVVTRRGKRVLAVLSWELYESIVETLEILSDEEQMHALKQGIKEVQAGKGIPWNEAKRKLGL